MSDFFTEQGRIRRRLEVQAIELGDLCRQAGENGFSVVILDENGG